MKLLVLAGGLGTRLKSVLPNAPKALAPVGQVPFLALQLENWIAQGIRSFVFLLHHQADQIQSFLDDAKAGLLKDCEVVCLVEPVPMDTGGAVAHAVRELGLDSDFLVTNADTWLGSGISQLMAISGAPGIAVVRVDDATRYGTVQFNDKNRVTAFVEKSVLAGAGWINSGLYRLRPELFRDWDGKRFSLERKTLPELVERGELIAIELKSDFIDIGISQDYHRFCGWIEQGRVGKLCN